MVFLRVTPQFYPQNWCEGKKCGRKVRDWKGWIKVIEKQILPSPLPRHYLPFSGIRSTNARHWNTSFLEWASRNSNQSCLPNSIQLQVLRTTTKCCHEVWREIIKNEWGISFSIFWYIISGLIFVFFCMNRNEQIMIVMIDFQMNAILWHFDQ